MNDTPQHDPTEQLDLESGLEALRSSPEFRGPVEQLDGRESTDHLALIYEDQEELFSAAIPFMRQGLERGERCLYIADDNSKTEVVAAMRAAGIDVDEWIDSEALSLHTRRDTYLRDGEFDPDDMISFLEALIAESIDEYEGLRVAGEMTWIFGDGPEMADLLEYEGKLNHLFPEVDSIALCQYNRQRFPAAVLRDVVRTHPHLVYDSTVCHNFYYTPPQEFFGPEEPGRELDRMLGTLRERTEAKVELQEREQYLQRQNEMTADPERSFEDKLQDLFDLGCERFGLELGALARVDPATDEFEIEAVSDDHDHFEPGVELPLSETYCEATIDTDGSVGVADPTGSEHENRTVHQEFGLRSYLGSCVEVEGGPDRTFFFVSSTPREAGFAEEERTFHRLMGQWVKYELERKTREDRLAALNALSRELMDAESDTGISEHLVDAAATTLDMPVTVVALYDDERGVLRVTDQTGAAEPVLEQAGVLGTRDDIGWRAFLDSEVRRTTGTQADALPRSITEVAAVPLGGHGVLLTATRGTGGFSSAELDFVETVAANTTAALDRSSREQQLHARERTLEEQNETLERLDEINTIIRSIDQALVGASTRAEIEQVVCAQLVEAGPYELAWIGAPNAVNRSITPRERAGSGVELVDELVETGGTDVSSERSIPARMAAQTREPRVVEELVDEPPFAPWRQAAINRGYRACIALPLIYDDTLYGVLSVYAETQGVFDDLERTVLTELSDNIAHAINAVENKRALVGDEVTELTFGITADDFESVELTRKTGGELVLESVVRRPDGGLRAFFYTRGVTAGEVQSFERRLPVTNVDLIADREEDDEVVCLFEADLDEESAPSVVEKNGGSVEAFRASGGIGELTIELAPDTTREFVQMFRRKYPGSELLGKQTRERTQQSLAEFQSTLTDDLTARQLEALQTAYFSEYFEHPRTRTSNEIAENMDISQPTFNHHLRIAQRKVFRELFEGRSL